MLFGKPAAPLPSPPDPEGTIRIGGIKVSVEQPGSGEVQITLHDKRIFHYKLFSVIDAHLQEKGFRLIPVLNQANGDGTARHFVDKPSIIIMHSTQENTMPLTAEAIETCCKELSERIPDSGQLTDAFGNVEQHKRNAAIAERFRQQNGGAQIG